MRLPSVLLILCAATSAIFAQSPAPQQAQAALADALVAIAESEGSIVSNGFYMTDDNGESPANLSVKELTNAICWRADLDVDCDGMESSVCNNNTDPTWLNMTSATTSTGEWLDAATLPYFVIPSKSAIFDWTDYPIELGAVAAIIYNGKICYAVFGDTGPEEIIGEASSAASVALGLSPSPANGGLDATEVTYIVFTGSSGNCDPIEDHDEAVSIGTARANELLLAYGQSGIVQAALNSVPVSRIGNAKITISSIEPHTVSIYAPSGRRVQQFTGSGAATYDLRETTAPGMYTVQLQTDNGIHNERVLVDR